MYLASGLPGPPGYQAPGPTRPYRALPGPTRTYQDLPDPTRPRPPKRPHAGSHTFLAAPKNTSKTTCFFLEPLENQKTQFYTVKCMFLLCSEGPKCQKTYILHCKMCVFPILEWNLCVCYVLKAQNAKNVFPILDWNFKFGDPESKTYILHCKIRFFGRSAVWREDFDTIFGRFWPFQGKHTFYTVKCMFLLFQEAPKKSMSFWRCFWGLPKKYVIQRVVQCGPPPPPAG